MSPGTTHRGDRCPPPASASAARSHLAKPPQGKQRVFLVALHADEQLQTGNASASCTSRLTPAHPWLLPIARMGGPGEPQRLMERGQPAPSIPSAAIPMETLFRFGGGGGNCFPKSPVPRTHWVSSQELPAGTCAGAPWQIVPVLWHGNRPFPSVQ